MADQQECSSPLDELLLEQFQGFEIKIVSRLVEYEYVCRPRKQPREQ